MFTDAARSNGLRFDVVRQVLTAIFRGQLKEGDRLIVQRLAKEFNISATPAREALLELSSFGAVSLLPNKGAVVRSFGAKQIREVYGLRSLLEVEAVRLACGKLPVDELMLLQAHTQRLLESAEAPDSSNEAVQYDRKLHRLIAEHCGQSYLAYEIDRISHLVSIARGVVGDIPRLKVQALQEHRDLIAALLAEDREESMRLMALHIQSACEILINDVFALRKATSEETEGAYLNSIPPSDSSVM